MYRIFSSLLLRLRTIASARRQALIVVVALFAICLLTVISSHRLKMPVSHSFHEVELSGRDLPESQLQLYSPSESVEEAKAQATRIERAAAMPSQDGLVAKDEFRPEPRIAFSADLAVIARDFLHARSSMEEILDRHRGYAARLRMTGHPAGSSLSATLKVPASEYSSALSDLKSIGDVQQDEEAADEIIQQRGDLEARLQNAKNNARRLEQLLKDNTDKSIDVAYVQRQLIALRAEIAKLELQRNNTDDRAIFSSIRFSLREVRETPAQTFSGQIHQAAAAGFTDIIATLSSILVFLVGYGPFFVLWTAILFFPIRYLWRRSKTIIAASSVEAAAVKS